MFRSKLLFLTGAAVVVALAACGGSGTGASVASAPTRAGAAAQAPASAAGKPAASGAAPAANAPSTATVPSVTIPEGPRVQRSATVVLQVDNGRFDRALDDVIAVAEAAGGYISGQNAQAAQQGERLRSGQVTFQVPADSFESVVNGIRSKGAAQSVVISGTDVSQQYVDLQARLGNAEAQRNAVLALMQQAKNVNDTIQIQNQLGQITSQIEQLKGQIDFLEHSTSYATIAVTIREAAVAAPRDDWGIQSATTQALHNVTTVLAYLILVLGSAAPLLVAAAVAFWAGRSAWRRFGTRSLRA